MSWETQYQGRSTPERILSDKESADLGAWRERYEEITTGQVKRLFEASPELRNLLRGVNPDDQRSIEALAVKQGCDEAILAAAAYSLKNSLAGLN